MSAYRSAPPASSAVVALLCAGCGARSEQRLARETYRCEGCGSEQAILRDDPLPGTVPFEVVSHEPGFADLAAFARTLGLDRGVMAATLRANGVLLEVSLDISSGVVTHLVLEVEAEGLTPMVLRRETDDDVDAKSRGVAREVETGDVEFDRQVFIESDAPDADVLALLGSPTVRAAVLSLLAAEPSLAITKKGIVLKRISGAGAFVPTRIARELVALRVLAGGARPLAPSAPSRSGWTPIVIVAAAVPLAVIGMVASERYPTVSARLFFIGVVAGLVAALPTFPLLSLALRGRSTSSRDIARSRSAALVTGPILVTSTLYLINGAFDASPARSHELVVVDIDRDAESGTRVSARGSEPGVGEHSFNFTDPDDKLALPATIRVRWRGGALGFPWQDGPAQFVGTNPPRP